MIIGGGSNEDVTLGDEEQDWEKQSGSTAWGKWQDYVSLHAYHQDGYCMVWFHVKSLTVLHNWDFWRERRENREQ